MTYQKQKYLNLQNCNKLKPFEILSAKVKNCTLCSRMHSSSRILGLSSGSLDAIIMFIGEAPGRRGADETGIPFHGDQAGHNFEELLEFVGISRENIFVTNAVLCNPKDHKGNNAPPKSVEIENCSNYLKQQIDLINSPIVVTLGANALKATSNIEQHLLALKKDVRSKNNWYNRILIPLYHPGQRAMIHRSMANQRSDYQFVSDVANRLGIRKHNVVGKTNPKLTEIVEFILTLKHEISYFTLHKLMYLLEYNHAKDTGERLTNAYFIRQKEGPYCTELHLKKLKNSMPNLNIRQNGSSIYLSLVQKSLFDDLTQNNATNKSLCDLIEKYIAGYSNKSDAQLKTSSYMTKPMREILKLEKNSNINMYNVPIIFPEKNITRL